MPHPEQYRFSCQPAPARRSEYRGLDGCICCPGRITIGENCIGGCRRAAGGYSLDPDLHLDAGGDGLGLATGVCRVRHHDRGVADRAGPGAVDDYCAVAAPPRVLVRNHDPGYSWHRPVVVRDALRQFDRRVAASCISCSLRSWNATAVSTSAGIISATGSRTGRSPPSGRGTSQRSWGPAASPSDSGRAASPHAALSGRRKTRPGRPSLRALRNAPHVTAGPCFNFDPRRYGLVRVMLTPPGASVRRTPWVVAMPSMTTPFWLRRVATAPPPARAAPAETET